MAKSKPDKDNADSRDVKRGTRYGRYAGLISIGITPLVVFMWLLRNQRLEHLPPTLQWFLMMLAFVSTLYLVGLVVLPWSRPYWLKLNFYNPAHWWGYLLPLANTLYIAFFATSGFAVISTFLYLRGLATTDPEHALENPFNDCFAYYIWRFLNAIPVLEIPKTIGWEMRLEFTDHITPVLLLLYKITLIGPIIAIGKLVWTDVRDRHSSDKK